MIWDSSTVISAMISGSSVVTVGVMQWWSRKSKVQHDYKTSLSKSEHDFRLDILTRLTNVEADLRESRRREDEARRREEDCQRRFEDCERKAEALDQRFKLLQAEFNATRGGHA